MSAGEDAELLAAWRRGDKVAGDELVRRHFGRVFRFFRRKLDDPDLAKDLAQKTFLTTLEIRDNLREGVRISAFFLGVARNVLLQELRTRARGQARDARAAGEPSIQSRATPSRVAALREEQQLLLDAMRTLPMDLQITVELHYWEQLSTREIAHVLEVAPGTIKWRLSKARDQLREAIEALQAPAELRESTVQQLDRWAESLREEGQ